MSMLAELVEVVIGVDTHSQTHTAAVVDARTGAVLAGATVTADPDGYAELAALAEQHSGLRAWAIEGTGGNTRTMIVTATRLRPATSSGDVEGIAALTVLRDLARRIRFLEAEALGHEQAIRAIVRSWRPDLLQLTGVGPIVAATVLTAWSHPGRCRDDAAFAMLAGVAPIPASSGKTVRYRLNRSGDRQLNRALHTVTLCRLQRDPRTRAYANRRRAQGKTDREIKRCLKRYIARELYRRSKHHPQRLDAS
jgi:transposase